MSDEGGSVAGKWLITGPDYTSRSLSGPRRCQEGVEGWAGLGWGKGGRHRCHRARGRPGFLVPVIYAGALKEAAATSSSHFHHTDHPPPPPPIPHTAPRTAAEGAKTMFRRRSPPSPFPPLQKQLYITVGNGGRVVGRCGDGDKPPFQGPPNCSP